MPEERVMVLTTTIASAVLALGIQVEETAQWPQFRGPRSAGIARSGSYPVEFGPDKNVAWKVAVPPGVSSPSIWANRIFLTAFTENRLETLCFDRSTGELVWRRAAPAERFE